MIIKLPQHFALSAVGEFLLQLDSYSNTEEPVIVDFSGLTYSYPFSTLAIGSGLRHFARKRHSKNLQTQAVGIDNRGVHSYLSHVGFFDYIYFPLGKGMGQARGSSSYTPIIQLEKSSLLSRVSPPYIELRHVILEESNRLARIFSSNSNSKNSVNILAYAIREIIRNVFEHSQSGVCYIFGQRWYDGSVEIGIIDEGVGVKETLSGTHQVFSDADALSLAVQPGVTRIQNLNINNIHDNSGFGLYILSRLGNYFGWFTMGSGKSHISWQNNQPYLINTNFSGTYVGLHLNQEPSNFEYILNEIIHEGEVEAHTMGRNVSASSSSRYPF